MGRGEEGLEEYERVKRELAAGTPLEIERSWEYASLIINSIETGEPCVIYGNVRNTGLITNLPDGHLRRGAVPGRLHGRQPDARRRRRAAVRSAQPHVLERLRPDGARGARGRIDHVRHAAMLDPNTAASLTLDGIDALVDEMLEAYRDQLPESLR